MTMRIKSDRRAEDRPESPERRGFPRPPLWLNLGILLVAIAVGVVAQIHSNHVDRRYASVIAERRTSPIEVNQLKQKLARSDLDRQQLQKQLQGKMEYVSALDSDDFYLAIDTKNKRMLFQYGDTVLRDAPVRIGSGGEIRSRSGRVWTFVPLKGSFRITGKTVGLDWQIPEWLYAMKGEPLPETPPKVPDGLGHYVVRLPNGYVIHSTPSDESPLEGPKPGSFMVPAEDLRAIWPRIGKGTRIYIF